jgi:hypothetical protein
MMSIVLCQVIELLVVFIDVVGPLLQIHKLLLLVVHETHRIVVPMEYYAELCPRDLVVVLKSSYLSGPSGSGRASKLLDGIHIIFVLCAVKQTKLGLSGVEPFIHLHWISWLGEEWRVSRQEVRVRRVHILVMGMLWTTCPTTCIILYQYPH